MHGHLLSPRNLTPYPLCLQPSCSPEGEGQGACHSASTPPYPTLPRSPTPSVPAPPCGQEHSSPLNPSPTHSRIPDQPPQPPLQRRRVPLRAMRSSALPLRSFSRSSRRASTGTASPWGRRPPSLGSSSTPPSPGTRHTRLPPNRLVPPRPRPPVMTRRTQSEALVLCSVSITGLRCLTCGEMCF